MLAYDNTMHQILTIIIAQGLDRSFPEQYKSLRPSVRLPSSIGALRSESRFFSPEKNSFRTVTVGANRKRLIVRKQELSLLSGQQITFTSRSSPRARAKSEG